MSVELDYSALPLPELEEALEANRDQYYDTLDLIQTIQVTREAIRQAIISRKQALTNQEY
jgi:hypothetical protein